MSLFSVLRTIWVIPFTKTTTDFGVYQRITKEVEGSHSPFFYGPLTSEIYTEMIREVGSDKKGIKVIRKVIDHMSANAHVPSLPLVQAIVKECINGRWPEALFKVLSYSQNKGVALGNSTWMDAITFYRYSLEFFNTGVKCIELALKNKATADWDLIELYVIKYFKHDMPNDAENLVKRIREEIPKQAKDEAERSKRVAEFVLRLLKGLLRLEEKNYATEYFREYLAAEKSSEDAIEVGFKYFEEAKNSTRALEFYRNIVKSEKFVYTPKFVASALRMSTEMGKDDAYIVTNLRDAILQNSDLASPFAINMIIISFGNKGDWEKLADFLLKVKANGLPMNKYTVPTVKKIIKECYVPMSKGKIVQLLEEIEGNMNLKS